MTLKTMKDLLSEHDFFKPMPEEYIEVIAGCGKNVFFKEGQSIAKEGDSADFFYIIRKGRLAIDVRTPHHQGLRVQTLGPDEILGWSWIFPPHKWTFDVEVLKETTAIALDGACLRKKCDADPKLGYFLMKEFAKIMTRRLKATRMQLLDLYGTA